MDDICWLTVHFTVIIAGYYCVYLWCVVYYNCTIIVIERSLIVTWLFIRFQELHHILPSAFLLLERAWFVGHSFSDFCMYDEQNEREFVWRN